MTDVGMSDISILFSPMGSLITFIVAVAFSTTLFVLSTLIIWSSDVWNEDGRRWANRRHHRRRANATDQTNLMTPNETSHRQLLHKYVKISIVSTGLVGFITCESLCFMEEFGWRNNPRQRLQRSSLSVSTLLDDNPYSKSRNPMELAVHWLSRPDFLRPVSTSVRFSFLFFFEIARSISVTWLAFGLQALPVLLAWFKSFS
jgi:hypothetical protein